MRLAAVAPIIVLAGIFVAVLATGRPMWRTTLGVESYQPSRCTWDCHNHGCRHRSVLPPVLTGDHGLFGWAIGALYRLGDRLVPGDRRAGYGLANLLVFCFAWPGLMYGLYLLALWQRAELRRGRA
jgi:hypothetical protein